MAERVIRGQKVQPIKAERARELRLEMTPEEKILWSCLREHRTTGLHFRRQQVIEEFIVDFYCHSAALVVEVDGPIHSLDPAYDQERDGILVGHGLQVLRVTNQQVRDDQSGVLTRIIAACNSESGSV